MHPQHAASARRQHFEIAARLQPLDGAEAVALARHRQVLGVVARNHQKHAGVRPALVRLPGRMQIPRPEADGRRDFPAIAHEAANRVERIPVRLVHLDERENREVVAVAQLIEQRRDVACALQRRLVVGKRARLLVLAGQSPRDDLRGLDVGLIERIHPEHRARDGGRKFPSIEFGAERVAIGPLDAHDRMTRALEPLDRGVGGRIRRAGRSQMDEHAIAAVDVGRARRLLLRSE